MSDFLQLQGIPDLFKMFGLESTIKHPLIAIIDFGKVKEHIPDGTKISGDLYYILCKDYHRQNIKYGRKMIDFQNGSLVCIAPNQVIEMENEERPTGVTAMNGWGIFFHPDLIRGTSLGNKLHEYSFFSYEVSESLHLSEKEKQVLTDCVLKIDSELQENIDTYSQSIIVSSLELLLNYCTRFYGRQFITRKTSNKTVVSQIEQILNSYFQNDDLSRHGLPTVKYLADQVNLSPAYLGDLLKKETGRNAQDHIHLHLIEAAKNILLGSDKSVGEIAYLLGFEYPQYFSKLFKQKTGKTPVEFRSMN
ncbi:AraC family transcriptional regulator [Mucilaginibacter conchicola]|uniref:AraC family transcriptional regulator n=1 Tax=Mucilaginibacter conchicola TaxID=2303333 RepID=A0A372NV37_9SPHI|nr:response regulator transcription factor [Mucilaginibacter conchicola]RFZ94023.1 AraC family transcriptional regulator [Mucilaginibacter conchicola]